jgi:hypothetical protein
MNGSQQIIDLLKLSLLLSGLAVISLKDALLLCLKYKYTDSTRPLTPKGLNIATWA